MRTYGAEFPLGTIEEWDDYAKFTRWIESVMYYSFLRSSIGGVPRCWFLKRLSSLYSPEGLPVGLEGFFPAENVTTWIVIRHGYRVWPILVVGRMMFNNSWNDFCRVHNLRIGCRVVFGCERRWVFNTFLFDENGKEMTYAWTNPYDPLQQLHPVPDHLRTACFPSMFEHEASLVRFLCEYTTENSLRLAFASFLAEYIEDLKVEALVFKAANRRWTLQVTDDGGFDPVAFSTLCDDLFLHPFDFVMVGVCFDESVRIIIFRSNDGSEKIVSDWEFNGI